MRIITFVSSKGGVGKTTLTAAMGATLAQRGKRVLLLDLDPQNALRHHLNMDPDDPGGMIRDGLIPSAVYDSPFGVRFMPFGNALDADLQQFCAQLEKDPQWVQAGIYQIIDETPCDYVLIDTPPGPGVFLEQALTACHLALGVVLADAASYAAVPALLPRIEEYAAKKRNFLGFYLLLNQLPHQAQLGHQVRAALIKRYPALMVPQAIHRDPSIPEALAYERPVVHYAPGCEASLDVQHLVDWLLTAAQ